MVKLYCLLLSSILFSTTSFAQRKAVNGYLQDSLTHLPIVKGVISNTTNKRKVETDASGFFRLEVLPNDLIYAIAKGYRYDTLRYAPLFADTITIFLPPVADMLENVTVTSGYYKYQMDSIERRRAFEEARGQTVSALQKSHTAGFGLIVNLDRFFKPKYKYQRRGEEVFNKLEKETYVNFRFSPQFVALYTGLKSDKLLAFIQQYKPSYEWLRRHTTREDLIDYINEKLKAYKQLRSGNGK